jgi:hypothetical protein
VARGHGERAVEVRPMAGTWLIPGQRFAAKLGASQRQSIPKQTIRILRKFPEHSHRICAKARTASSSPPARLCDAAL